jgi:serine/threonine-protein kinase
VSEGAPTLDGRVDAHRATMHAGDDPAPQGAAAPGPQPPEDGPRSGEVPSTTFASWIGRTIDDRYRIDALLGEGGMGAVLLAEHLKLGKKVALKVVLPQFAGVGEVAERFAREAMASGQLDHPHIASALDYGTLPEGGAYLVMQYVRGRSLRDVMPAHAGDWAFACEVGAQIADALSAAHASRIVHRDLKPENVMLEQRDGATEALHVRVLDFGVARMVGDDAAEGPGARKLTRVGTVIGTPGYMAPEQALGEPVDERADLYALGVLLWECILGRELFEGADVPSIVTAQLTQTIEPLGALHPDVPAELDALVFRLLAPRRDDRPGKATEVRDTLRKLALARQLARVSLGDSGSFAVDPSRPFATGAGLSSGGAAAPSSPATPSAPATPAAPAHAKLPLASLLPPAIRARGRGAYLAIAAAAAFVFVVAGVMIGVVVSNGDGPAPTPVAPPTPPVPVAAPTPTSPPVVPTTPPPTTPPPRVESVPATPVVVPAAPVPFPPELTRDVTILLASETRETRRTAAEALLARPAGTLPPTVQAMAELELGEGCSAKRNALRTLRELRDPRALPVVERIDRLPRRGCGMFDMGDCWSCLRGETRRTLRSLRGDAEAAEPSGEE